MFIRVVGLMMNKNKLTMMIVVVMAVILFRYMFNAIFKNDEPLRKIAENKVSLFQSLYNSQYLDKIYNESCDDFQQATSRDEFLSIMNGKMEVFGEFEHSILLHSNVINSKKIILSYRTTYKHYSLIEEFTYSYNDKKDLCLQSFYIDDSGKRGNVIKLK